VTKHEYDYESSPTFKIVERAIKAVREMPWSEFVAIVSSEQRRKLLIDLHAAVEAVLSEVETFKKKHESRNR